MLNYSFHRYTHISKKKIFFFLEILLFLFVSRTENSIFLTKSGLTYLSRHFFFLLLPSQRPYTKGYLKELELCTFYVTSMWHFPKIIYSLYVTLILKPVSLLPWFSFTHRFLNLLGIWNKFSKCLFKVCHCSIWLDKRHLH